MALIAEHAISELEKDLGWREIELALMRKQLIASIAGTPQESALLRANLAMIYAHYEGFCKFALELYVISLQRLNPDRIDLAWPLASFTLKSLHKELLNEKDESIFFTRLLNELNKEIDAKAEFEKPPQISNLWPDLLIEWLTKLHLEKESTIEHANTLHQLVNNRNQIAHGKKLMIQSRKELDKYADAAQTVMHEVALGICYALEHKKYKRHGRVMTIIKHATI
ncbi:MAE_28990/MAE_18760 family HEPN-like nuclease [Pseudomonas sp.]|uniref:MAE_28990/MAE_18760 family HEPN-like nuclease n=1 Tax=Pseudomonas sp. TaxID=306 RepID=UPI0040549DF7